MPLHHFAEATQKVATGDYLTRLREDRRDEIGDLAVAFNRMTATLIDSQRLVKANTSGISAALQRAQSFDELAHTFFFHLAPLVHIGQASLYRVDDTSTNLGLCGAYGRSLQNSPDAVIAIGSGLLGQCAQDRRPLVSSDKLQGMLEMATLKTLDEAETAMIDSLLPVLAMCMEIIDRNDRLQQLLLAAQKDA
jgi:nitrate/nitrite-specific signal transduction histidine kinase